MGLAEELFNPPVDKPNRCGTCNWLATQPSDVQEAFEAAKEDPRWTQSALYRLLSKRGLPVKETQFRRHYRGMCHD